MAFICVTVTARAASGPRYKERNCFLDAWWCVHITQVWGRTNVEVFFSNWYVPDHLLGLFDM